MLSTRIFQNQQHTFIQTPETSQVHLESLTGVAVRQTSKIVSPFDFSDSENLPNAQRRLITDTVPCCLNFDNDQDDDEEQATCSSTKSSPIEPQIIFKKDKCFYY
ncbi:uncharacterized protein CELE_Y60A9A.1 [Caenorhabditis elegans]|uniref:Uncharacterized protein n=1 Tax=Caenorhabditis elegans TaxID=6239 RepID=Q7YWN7_CAEEL|nr:Uncharacterized protein CELE_Y60A9A.1 [Caenorhabditis elegans]CAE18032.2 Uncharacterized protein CELE_Y60A9A.1 [Caenorhabditis elegans]